MGEIWDQMNGLYVLVAHQARPKRILLWCNEKPAMDLFYAHVTRDDIHIPSSGWTLSHKSDPSWIVGVHGRSAPYQPNEFSTKRRSFGGNSLF